MNVKRAVILVAGFGSRRLPVTKSVEKCMLPIGNRPMVDYTVDECLAAGVEEIIFVVDEHSDQIRKFYGQNVRLEAYLRERGKFDQLEEIINLNRKATFRYVTQTADMPYGTAVAVGLCADLIGEDEQIIVASGDNFVYNHDGGSEIDRLVKQMSAQGVTAGLLATRVPMEEVSKYGVIQTSDHDGKLTFERIVEQPNREDAPSNLINISKYIFDAPMMRYVKDVLASPPAANGEYQVIEALNRYVASGRPLAVIPIEGMYLDGGTERGWLQANNFVLNYQHEQVPQPTPVAA